MTTTCTLYRVHRAENPPTGKNGLACMLCYDSVHTTYPGFEYWDTQGLSSGIHRYFSVNFIFKEVWAKILMQEIFKEEKFRGFLHHNISQIKFQGSTGLSLYMYYNQIFEVGVKSTKQQNSFL